MNDTLNSEATNLAATANAVKQLNDKFADYVTVEGLEDGLEVDEITSEDITINGVRPSLEGHTHEIEDVNELSDILNSKADKSDTILTPEYGSTPTFGEWNIEPSTVSYSGTTYNLIIYDKELGSGHRWCISHTTGSQDQPLSDVPYDATAETLTFTMPQDFSPATVTATRSRTDIIGYTLGDQINNPIQPKGNYITPDDCALLPIYSDTPTFTNWSITGSGGYDFIYMQLDSNGWNLYMHPTGSPAGTIISATSVAKGDATSTSLHWTQQESIGEFTATRSRTDIIGYTLGDQIDNPIQPQILT